MREQLPHTYSQLTQEKMSPVTDVEAGLGAREEFEWNTALEKLRRTPLSIKLGLAFVGALAGGYVTQNISESNRESERIESQEQALNKRLELMEGVILGQNERKHLTDWLKDNPDALSLSIREFSIKKAEGSNKDYSVYYVDGLIRHPYPRSGEDVSLYGEMPTSCSGTIDHYVEFDGQQEVEQFLGVDTGMRAENTQEDMRTITLNHLIGSINLTMSEIEDMEERGYQSYVAFYHPTKPYPGYRNFSDRELARYQKRYEREHPKSASSLQ